MKVTDEWEALFRIWHERAHAGELVGKALSELERRIVKLEAWQKSLQAQIAREARLG